MPKYPEHEPLKSSEPPKKAEKGTSAKSGRDAAIEEAKKTIEDITSKDESVRMEAIRKLRNPPLENLDKAKEVLKTAPISEIDWLVHSADDVQHSPEVALFAAKIAQSGELKDDPRWLLAKTVELAYSARADATSEARHEINAAVFKVKGRLQDILAHQEYEGVDSQSYDLVMYGSSLNTPLALVEKDIFDEKDPDKETITDPELIRLLREINKKIRTDPVYLHDHESIEADIKQLQKTASDRSVPESQIREAITRLRGIKNSIVKEAIKSNERYPKITYEEMRKTLLKEDQAENPLVLSKEFHYLTPDEVELLREGEEGQQKFFYEFVSKIYSMGRTPGSADITDAQRYKEFEDFMTWLHPNNTDYHFGKYDYMWKEMPKHYQIVKNLLFTPGDIKDKLRNLQFLTPADMDHYIKNINHANYALSLYEDAIFDKLSDRQVKYKEALAYLKGRPDALKRYKELSTLRKKGRLDASVELEFQTLQEQVDLVGYGVNLWDSDIQNYSELDLEINEMSRELDRLNLKIENGQELTEWENNRSKMLKSEIAYKQGKVQDAKRIEGYGQDLKKSQHNNRGLSQVDIDVKERLRMLLEDRFPGKNIQEWELNQAVWAARQWMIGSGRLVSISSGMAIRPNEEFNKTISEVNGGKYVMRAPAMEDLQRVVNPEFFEARFGMGDTMGDIFRALTDKGLLESKGYTFKNDPKYRNIEEKNLDITIRQTREFIRQVEDETGTPYTEILTQGIFQGGGNFDKTMWRAEIATVDEIRKKYLDMQKRGDLPAGARVDNQALGIQLLLSKNTEGKIEILNRMVGRTPSKLFHLLGKPVNELYKKYGLTPEEQRKFRQALSVAQIDTWDVNGQQGKWDVNGQQAEKRDTAFRDVNLLDNRTDFDTILRPYLEKEGFSAERIENIFSLLNDAKIAFESKVGELAKHESPITYTITDMDWKDAEMFQTGTIALDRRARDMGQMAAARDAWIAMHKPDFLTNHDPKETLKKLKEFREAMNNYTTGKAAEDATYELAKAWLNFNKNRMINYENREGNAIGAVKGFLRTIPGWVPGWHVIKKNLGEVDIDSGIGMFLARERGPEGKKFRLLGKTLGEGTEKWLKEFPINQAQDISYAVRFTGPHGNAFEEKQLDEILDSMLQMGIFNANEHLYHKLRKEMHVGMGDQIRGLIRKYWWLLPLLTAAYGAKEGIEEEKKR